MAQGDESPILAQRDAFTVLSQQLIGGPYSGATRSLRRAVSLRQAFLLAGVGSLIGAVLGVLTAGALALPGGPLPFAPPWLPLAIVAIGVPVLIGIGAWIFAGRSTALPTDRTAIA